MFPVDLQLNVKEYINNILGDVLSDKNCSSFVVINNLIYIISKLFQYNTSLIKDLRHTSRGKQKRKYSHNKLKRKSKRKTKHTKYLRKTS